MDRFRELGARSCGDTVTDYGRQQNLMLEAILTNKTVDEAWKRFSKEFPHVSREDFDFYFGTLFNRWCAMAVIGEPLTVYGTGEQIKPFIHVEDAAQSLVDIINKNNSGEYRVYNQLTEYIRIIDLASMIANHMKT